MKKENKLGRLDIKATINKSQIINIEIQLRNEQNMEKRSEFYGARLITDQMGKGEEYEELKPVILINILNYNLLEVPEYYTKTVTVAEKHRNYEVIKDITYYFIELPKFRKSKPKLANLLECWLAIIDGENGGLIKMAEKKEKIIKEASEEVEEILSDEELKALMEFRQTAIWEENSRMAYKLRKAKEKIEKKAEKEKEKAVEKAVKDAKKEKTIEIAKELLKLNVPVKNILKITGLTEEEIRKINS